MTKCAVYEETEGKETLPLSRYHRWDFVSAQMFLTFFASTLAFLIIGGSIAVYLIESGMDFSSLNFVSLIVLVIVLYAAWEVGFLMITFVRYRRKYFSARRSLKKYYEELKTLNAIYKGEKS